MKSYTKIFFSKRTKFFGCLLLLAVPALCYWQYENSARSHSPDLQVANSDQLGNLKQSPQVRDATIIGKVSNEVPIKRLRPSAKSTKVVKSDLLIDNSSFISELKIVDATKLPLDYAELCIAVSDRIDSAERFASPYYEEICLRFLSKIVSWISSESDWPPERTIKLFEEIYKDLQGRDRDSGAIVDSFTKSFTFAVRDSESLNQYVTGIDLGENQLWLARLKGTLIGIDITNQDKAENRIQSIAELQNDPARAYAEGEVLSNLPAQVLDAGRLFFLSRDSVCLRDNLLLDHLFPTPDENIVKLILNSDNVNHRDWALSNLALKTYYLNDAAGVASLISKISDNQIKNETTKNIEAAKSRGKQIGNLVPKGAPPGLLE